MENFEIVEDKTLELTFIVKDESHGVCNALRHILMQDPDVEYAVYNIDHPLTGKPEMTIKTKRGKRPRVVLKKAAEELQEQSSEFKKLIEIISVGSYFGYFYRPCIVKAKKSGRKEERQDRKARFHRWADLSKGVRQVVALVEFDDGHMEQVQPDRIIFCKEEEE